MNFHSHATPPPLVSAKQQDFLHREAKRRFLVITARLALFAAFLLSWEICAKKEIINDFIFSSPSRIAATFLSMAKSGELFTHCGITLWETLASFTLVITLSILIAVILWSSESLAKILEPYLVILNSLPKSALAPVLIVWLGNNQRAIIVTAVSVAVFGAIINIYTGFREIDPEKVRLIRMLGGSRLDILTKLILPGSLPLIISTTKVNIGLCLVGVIIGEFLAAKKGLGYLIIYGSQTFRMDWVLMSITILCCMAGLMYFVVGIMEKHQSGKTF